MSRRLAIVLVLSPMALIWPLGLYVGHANGVTVMVGHHGYVIPFDLMVAVTMITLGFRRLRDIRRSELTPEP